MSYMGITLPTNSTNTSYGTSAQIWSGIVSEDLFIIDPHDHTSGNGASILFASLSAGNLDCNGFEIKNIGYVNLFNNVTIDGILSNSIYQYGNDLWYRNNTPEDVQITDSGSIPSDSVAGFFGDYGDDGSTFVYYPDNYNFVAYGDGSTNLASLYAYSFSGNYMTVATSTGTFNCPLSGTYVTNGAAYFPFLTYKCPNTTNGLNDCFPDISQSYISYPHTAMRDAVGGISLNFNDAVTINPSNTSFYASMGLGFEYAYNLTGSGKYILKYSVLAAGDIVAGTTASVSCTTTHVLNNDYVVVKRGIRLFTDDGSYITPVSSANGVTTAIPLYTYTEFYDSESGDSILTATFSYSSTLGVYANYFLNESTGTGVTYIFYEVALVTI